MKEEFPPFVFAEKVLKEIDDNDKELTEQEKQEYENMENLIIKEEIMREKDDR